MLNEQQQKWVDDTLSSMSLEEKIGHLFCPSLGEKSEDEVKKIIDTIPLGCAFFADWELDKLQKGVEVVQKNSRIPVLIAADMEKGFGAGTKFPVAIGCIAGSSPEQLRDRGRTVAREARSAGIHWSFAPVADMPMNFQNPEVNARVWGHNADTIIKNMIPVIEGMQEDNLLAATAKHFPGNGYDDRDQHLCTQVNYLKVDEWMETYGRVWKAAFEAGVMSVMAGHISLPYYEGLEDNPTAALPATLNRKLQVDLLREELGFEGVLVSDAAVMVGIASRVPYDDMAVANIKAGSDVFLFPRPIEDGLAVKRAIEEGELDMQEIEASVKRVLAMKARLGLPEALACEPPTEKQKKSYQVLCSDMSEKAVTVIRNDDGLVGKSLEKGSKVLTVSIRFVFDGDQLHRYTDLTVIDELLKERGFEVDHVDNPGHDKLRKAIKEYDRIFVNIQHPMHVVMGTMRVIGHMAMQFWMGFWTGQEKTVFTSFGNPFVLYEFPHFPNMVLTYSDIKEIQNGVVPVWLGEKKPQGTCPLPMPKLAGPVENVVQ